MSLSHTRWVVLSTWMIAVAAIAVAIPLALEVIHATVQPSQASLWLLPPKQNLSP